MEYRTMLAKQRCSQSGLTGAIGLLWLGLLPIPGAAAAEISPMLSVLGKGELALQQSKQQSSGLQPWWQGGTGQLAAGTTDLFAGPQLLALQLDTDTDWSATVHGQWHRIPTAAAGITEAWLSYQPLPVDGYRFKARAGYFYPAMSLENTDIAWSSPYSSSFSVLNSWLAEELRARGAELSLSRPGRFFQSSHSWVWVGGLFQGNDPLGTMLSWRGFASHNAQTNLGEQVRFANYPSLRSGVLALQPNWVQPTRELDHRTGYYLGLHWLYRDLRQQNADPLDSEIRVYHYDNNGDPRVFRHGQYAWDSKFSNLAWQQQLSQRWSLVSQYLTGSTEMGYQTVSLQYQSWFSLLHLELDHFSSSLRFDHWQQQDQDTTVGDDNSGKGHGWTWSVHYPWSANFGIAVEFSRLNSHQPSRAQWDNWPVQQHFQQVQLLLTWRLD